MCLCSAAGKADKQIENYNLVRNTKENEKQ